MSKLVHAGLETNDENSDGLAVTLYYEGNPTDAEVVADLEGHPVAKKLPCSVDTKDRFFSAVRSPAPHAPGLVRVQAHPTV
jgi:hypothetical protein